MDRVSGGYTILEVMLVMTMTSLLFLGAMLAINGQSGETNFNQAMQDVTSKLKNYVSQIGASSYAGSDSYTCSVTSGRPLLSAGGSANNGCIFVGRAFQALQGAGTINVYTVLADANEYSGCATDTGLTAQTLDQACPEAAILKNNSGVYSYAMNDTYTLGSSAKIVSSKITAASGTNENDLVGIYNGLPGDASASTTGTAALIIRGYPCAAATCPVATPVQSSSASGMQACIEEKTVSVSLDCKSANISTALQWDLCLSQGSGGNATNSAKVTLISAPGGITTQLAFGKCT